MALLQALLALITKSAGKILNAIFGWAVRALFGQTSSAEQTFLSVVVAAAVAWPLLLVGAAIPKLAALLVAFVPLPHSVPSWTVRVVWLGLAVLVPFGVGVAVAAKAPPHAPPESGFKRVLRGFPITIGLASAFLLMFISVPVMRLYALARGLQSADVPLVTDVEAYHEVAALICEVLDRHGFKLRRRPPGWWVAAPTRILGWFGGEAFRAYVPDRLEHFTDADLELSMYPSGILLRGQKDKVTWAHGIIAETVVRSQGYQTSDVKAQALEKQLRTLWKLYEENPAAHAGSSALLGRLREITRALGTLPVSFDDWQVLYRQILQVERAVRGQHQLLDEEAPDQVGKSGGKIMTADEKHSVEGVTQLSTPALLKEISGQVGLLAEKQIELARAEVLADLRREASVIGRIGIAAALGLAGAILLLVTGVLALALLMPAWMAGSLVTGVTLLAAAILSLVSWRRRVRRPLARTRTTLKDDVSFVKERVA
jgi:putative superfamily III holin-X